MVVEDGLLLRLGAEVVARVVSSPANGGRGLLALAGALVRAELPAGLQAGMRLPLVVDGADAGRVVLKVRREAAAAEEEGAALQLASALALRGDGDMLRAALALAGGALPLPGGRAATVEVDPDDSGGGGGAEAASARLVLHSPTLGPIEIRLGLAAGVLDARVLVEPGEAAALAAEAAPELARALERAAPGAARVDVASRAATESRPRPPRSGRGVDAYA